MKRKFSLRLGHRLVLCFVLSLLALGSQQACLPGPTSLQVESVVNCGAATEPITQGVLDLKIIDTYYMKLSVLNMLVITGDPSLFRPETNYVDLKEVKIWFEYPQDFSQKSLGSQFLKTQENPLIIPLAQTLRPSIQPDFIGQQGTAGGVTITGQTVEFFAVPTELSRFWFTAAELSDSRKNLTHKDAKRTTGPSFQVIAHITLSGMTRAGQLVATPEYKFPIRICNGCLDYSDQNKEKPSLCAGGAGAGASGRDCSGQDNICFSPQQGGG